MENCGVWEGREGDVTKRGRIEICHVNFLVENLV